MTHSIFIFLLPLSSMTAPFPEPRNNWGLWRTPEIWKFLSQSLGCCLRCLEPHGTQPLCGGIRPLNCGVHPVCSQSLMNWRHLFLFCIKHKIADLLLPVLLTHNTRQEVSLLNWLIIYNQDCSVQNSDDQDRGRNAKQMHFSEASEQRMNWELLCLTLFYCSVYLFVVIVWPIS